MSEVKLLGWLGKGVLLKSLGTCHKLRQTAASNVPLRKKLRWLYSLLVPIRYVLVLRDCELAREVGSHPALELLLTGVVLLELIVLPVGQVLLQLRLETSYLRLRHAPQSSGFRGLSVGVVHAPVKLVFVYNHVEERSGLRSHVVDFRCGVQVILSLLWLLV